MKYLISDKALGTIERECRLHPEAETGGILAGFREAERVVITHATGPGLHWESSESHFVKDTSYLQSVLDLLFQYFQINYLGVWHKHPPSMRYPSHGDIASAMEEISDRDVGLGELLTPICVLEGNRVEVFPYVIKDNESLPIEWSTIPHGSIAKLGPGETQWHTRSVGKDRLVREMKLFEELGIQVDVKEASDGTYRFHATRDPKSSQRLVMLCANDYPFTPPDIALYDHQARSYQPVSSEILDNWNIDRYLGAVAAEFWQLTEESPGISN